jgi:putative inorganic carbon (HCO3(-)) transporter
MRDIAVTVIILGLLPFVFSRPHWGVLLWTWVGLMNPHKLTWGFAYDFPFAVIVGVTTLIAVVLSREPKRIPWQAPVVALALLIAWFGVTTVFSLYPTEAWAQWQKVMKIQLFIFVTLMIMQTKERINAVVWVSTLSLAFFGIKGGIYTLQSGGGGMVLGPDGGFISGNTEISLALTMTIPLMRWLQLQTPKRWLRWGLGISMVLVAVAVLGSYSRGGLLAILAMLAFLWLKSRRKLVLGLFLVAMVPFALLAMPDQWYQKMSTIQTYDSDSSAKGRINAWGFAWNLAQIRPLTGGGFQTFEPDAFEKWAPDPYDFHDAHSIWFQLLGEHGFVGLGLFLILWFCTWRTANAIIREGRDRVDLRWAVDLAAMLQVALIGYWVGGTFLGLGYWDYPYILMALLVLTRVVVLRALQSDAPQLATHSDGFAAAARAHARPDSAPG